MKTVKNIVLGMLVIILIILLAIFSQEDKTPKTCIDKQMFTDKYNNKMFDTNKYNIVKECE